MTLKLVNGELVEVDELGNPVALVTGEVPAIPSGGEVLVVDKDDLKVKPSAEGGEVEITKVGITDEVVEESPKYTEHYLSGVRVLITTEQKEKYDSLLSELTTLHDNRGVADIPVSDPYYAKKAELDAFVGGLRR